MTNKIMPNKARLHTNTNVRGYKVAGKREKRTVFNTV